MSVTENGVTSLTLDSFLSSPPSSLFCPAPPARDLEFDPTPPVHVRFSLVSSPSNKNESQWGQRRMVNSSCLEPAAGVSVYPPAESMYCSSCDTPPLGCSVSTHLLHRNSPAEQQSRHRTTASVLLPSLRQHAPHAGRPPSPVHQVSWAVSCCSKACLSSISSNASLCARCAVASLRFSLISAASRLSGAPALSIAVSLAIHSAPVRGCGASSRRGLLGAVAPRTRRTAWECEAAAAIATRAAPDSCCTPNARPRLLLMSAQMLPLSRVGAAREAGRRGRKAGDAGDAGESVERGDDRVRGTRRGVCVRETRNAEARRRMENGHGRGTL